jgi:HK97 family phage major capsid protein
MTDSNLLPTEFVGDIFSKAKQQSILMQYGQQIPVSLGETSVYVGGDKPAAGQVGGTTLASREGAEKPVAGLRYGTRQSFMPIKLAVIITASREYALVNPDQMWTKLATDLPAAIARAADLAVVHGRDALRGTALNGIAVNGFINETTNRVELDTSAGASPDMVDQLIAGWKLVVGDDDKDYDFTNWAYAPEIVPDIVTLRRSDGTPVFYPASVPSTGSEINLNAGVGSLLGIPAAAHRVVHGKVDNAPKTNVRILGGDFSQLAYGFADQITFRITDQASLSNGAGGVINLWQTNQVAVLCEATFGWLVNDPDAFVAFELPAAP